jgi:hypothetical protein
MSTSISTYTWLGLQVLVDESNLAIVSYGLAAQLSPADMHSVIYNVGGIFETIHISGGVGKAKYSPLRTIKVMLHQG